LDDVATPATVTLAYRAALVAQRHRLRVISIDVLSDEPWPEGVLPAVEALETRVAPQRVRLWRRSRAEPSITVDADAWDEETFAHLIAIAPFTIRGTGIDDGGRTIWTGSDTGTSFAVRLTPREEQSVRRVIADGGGDPAHLVPLL
jgi:hypothetical protein